MPMHRMHRMTLLAVWTVADVFVHIHGFVSTLTVPALCYPNTHISDSGSLGHNSGGIGHRHTQTTGRQHRFRSETQHCDVSKAEITQNPVHPCTMALRLDHSAPVLPHNWQDFSVRAGIMDCRTLGAFCDQISCQRDQRSVSGVPPGPKGTPLMVMSSGLACTRASHQDGVMANAH